MQIGQFDFDNAIKGIARENQIEIEKRFTTTEADLHKTLEDLSTLLKDRGVLASMWPDASVDDPALYSHLNIKIDQHLSRIELFTAASSPDGTPLRLKVYDISQELDLTRDPNAVPVPAPEAIPPTYTPTNPWQTNSTPVYTQPAAPTNTATPAQPAGKSID